MQAKAAIWFLICSFMQKGIAMITTPIFTRLLSTNEFGQYSIFISWMNIISILVTLNLFGGVYQRGLIKYKGDRNVFSSSLQGLTLTLCILWTFVYCVAHTFWNEILSLTTVQMLAMMIMVWSSAVFAFWSTEQRVLYRYQLLVLTTIFVSLGRPVVEIFCIIHADDKVTARILAAVGVQLIMYTWMFYIQLKNGHVFFKKEYWLHALSFNLPLVPHYLSQVVLSTADRIMIQKMVNFSSAGIYSLACSLSFVMVLFNSALMDSLTPWIYTKIQERKIHDLAPVAYGSLALIAGVNILLIAFAPEAVRLFAPKEYYDAIWCIPPVAMSVYFMYCYDLFAKFEFYYSKTHLIATATMIGAAVNITLNWLLIDILGYIAAAYTTLLCYALYAVLHFIAMEKICDREFNGDKPYSGGILLIITTAFVSIGMLFLALYNYTVIRYSACALIILFIIVYRKSIISFIKNIKNIKTQK